MTIRSNVSTGTLVYFGDRHTKLANNIQNLYPGRVQSDLVDGDLVTTVKPARFLKRNILPNFGESVVDAIVAENGSVVGRVVEVEFSTRTKIEI